MPTINFDAFPVKASPRDANEIKTAPTDDDQYYYLFVDYDLISVDSADPYKIYGNWRDAPGDACRYKKVDAWVDRRNLYNYNFVEPCEGSRDGIWRFWLYKGGRQ